MRDQIQGEIKRRNTQDRPDRHALPETQVAFHARADVHRDDFSRYPFGFLARDRKGLNGPVHFAPGIGDGFARFQADGLGKVFLLFFQLAGQVLKCRGTGMGRGAGETGKGFQAEGHGFFDVRRSGEADVCNRGFGKGVGHGLTRGGFTPFGTDEDGSDGFHGQGRKSDAVLNVQPYSHDDKGCLIRARKKFLGRTPFEAACRSLP